MAEYQLKFFQPDGSTHYHYFDNYEEAKESFLERYKWHYGDSCPSPILKEKIEGVGVRVVNIFEEENQNE
jgi:hypothetical protein